MFNFLKTLYNDYTEEIADQRLKELSVLVTEYISSSSMYKEHLDAAKEALSAFNSSPKSSSDLKNLFVVLHASIKHCSECFTHKNGFTRILGQDIIEGKMYSFICSLL